MFVISLCVAGFILVWTLMAIALLASLLDKG